jgi:hypothetical protein
VLVLALLVTATVPGEACGQRQFAVLDEQIVREAQLVASGARIDLYEHGVGVERALVTVAEQALARMEQLLGRKLDEATLGPRIHIYVSASTRVSHVWRGYRHPSDPKPIVFLNPSVAGLAVSGTNATYAHELAHLLTWRYRSHTLREGLADYLALQLHPRAGIGPNLRGYSSPPAVPQEVNQYLGTIRAPPEAVVSDAYFRSAYYYASYRFVRYLIGRADMETFLKLYEAEDPGVEISRLYGASLQELVAAAAK